MEEFMNQVSQLRASFLDADWLPLVNWTFWAAVVIVASGGILCARNGKKSLINRGISGTLNLISIYLTGITLCCFFPALRSIVGKLPFLLVTDSGIALMAPWQMELTTALPGVLLQFILMLVLLQLVDLVVPGNRTVMAWILTQFLSNCIALVIYAFIVAGAALLFPSYLYRWSLVLATAVILCGCLIFLALILLVKGVKMTAPAVANTYKFFTANTAGSMLSVTGLVFLLSGAFLSWLCLNGNQAIRYAEVDYFCLLAVMLLLLISHGIFNIFYQDRKRG